MFLRFAAQSTPFTIDVKFDENEDTEAAGAITDEQDATASSAGIVGFSLNYRQIACT